MTYHILLYTDDPGDGGVAQYNHTMLLALVEQGYRVTAVQSRRATPLVQEQQRYGVHHQWLRFNTAQDFSRTVSDGSDAERIFRQTKPDLVLFSDSCPASHLMARHQTIRHGIPFLMVEGFVAPAMTQHFRSPVMAQNGLALLHTQFQAAQEVIAVSQENLNLLHQQYGLSADQGRVIHYGRPDSFFAPTNLSTRQRLRQELGIPEAVVLCFTAARLEHVKGHQHLLSAIAQLRSTPSWSELHFVWAGEGGLRPELEEQIVAMEVGDRVHLLGQRWDIPDWFDAADLFILPSSVEGMPLSIMEAMAKGVPVMASAVSGIPEELGDTGILLPPPDQDAEAMVQALVQGITAWATDPSERAEQGERSRQRANTMFRQQRMVDETLSVIEGIIRNPKPMLLGDMGEVEAIADTFQDCFFPPADYISPGLHRIRPDAAFPNMDLGQPQGSPWPYLRREVPHPWYVDRRHPFVGFLSRDEAHILYNLALPFQRKRALEIGCWMGWSACHLALAGVVLDVVDPMLAQAEFYESVSDSLQQAGVGDSVTLIPGFSPPAVEAIATQHQRTWPLIFIDGDHETVGPLMDAIACEKLADADALIVFHDLASPYVAEGLEYFRRRGWKTQVYQTMQIMGVAWRGNVSPITHQPDPRVAWSLPKHLHHFAVSGQEGAIAPPPEDWSLSGAERLQRIEQLMQTHQFARAYHFTEVALEEGDDSPEIVALRQQILTATGHDKPMETILPIPLSETQQADLAETYRLQDYNLIAFPDWQQPDEVLFEELVRLLKRVYESGECDRTTLLIYTGDLEAEVADMALSSVTLHLLSEENVPLDEGSPELVLLTPMEDGDWRLLLPHLHKRVVLAHEDEGAIATVGANSVSPLY